MNSSQSVRRGPKPKDPADVRDYRLQVRLSARERKLVESAASEQGTTPATEARRLLLRWAKRSR